MPDNYHSSYLVYRGNNLLTPRLLQQYALLSFSEFNQKAKKYECRLFFYFDHSHNHLCAINSTVIIASLLSCMK